MDPQNQITGLLSLDRYNLDQQQEQPQQINIEATIENLEKEGYSPSRIIDIMGQYGYEREEAVDQYTAVLDARRDAQLADQEQRRKIEEDQRSAFFSLDQQMEDSVKKKDSALGLGGGPSGLPSDSQEELISPVADPTLVDLASRRDTNISDVFVNSSTQKSLDSLLQIAEVYDEYGLNVKDKSQNQRDLLRDLSEKYGDKIQQYSDQLEDLGYDYGVGRLMNPEARAEFISDARSELMNIQGNYSKILENANRINEEIGVDLRYNPSSNKDLGLFLRGAYEYTLSVDEQIQKEANDFYASIPQSTIDALVDINKENLDREYNAGSLGGRLAEGFADKTFQLVANVRGTVWDWVSYFPDDGSAAARAQEARDVAGFFANRQQARKFARQKYLGVGDDISSLGITEKLFNLTQGDYEGRAGEVWASLFGDVEGAVGDGLWSAAEFWAGGPKALGSIMFVDVASSNYNYNKKHNPHMSVIENTLSSGRPALQVQDLLRQEFLCLS